MKGPGNFSNLYMPSQSICKAQKCFIKLYHTFKRIDPTHQTASHQGKVTKEHNLQGAADFREDRIP